MLATMSQQAPTTTIHMVHPSAPKRPRLSLETTTPAAPTIFSTPGTALKADNDPLSATAFNTLSNAYAAAIQLSSPKVAQPQASLNSSKAVRKSGLRLVTNASSTETPMFPSQHTQTPGPFTITYPDSPGAAHSATSPSVALPDMWPGAATYSFTPPQSAHPSDEPMINSFSYTPRFTERAAPSSPQTPRRRASTGAQNLSAPYTHPRSLHSILRNSPLPPRSSTTPKSPGYSSRRSLGRTAKKLCFNSPLTQTITTKRYIKSHIDLLAEDASPYSASDTEGETIGTLDLAMAYTGDETRDGGQTPGPFEEMRRRMAKLEPESEEETPASKKRKRKEKKRQWVWTIGTNEDELEELELVPTISPYAGPSPSSFQVQHTSSHPQLGNLDHMPSEEICRVHGDAEDTPLATVEMPSKVFEEDITAPVLQEISQSTMQELRSSYIMLPPISVGFIGDNEGIERPTSSHSI